MRPTEETFWEQTQKTEACWLWLGGRTPSGYGRVRWRGIQMRAHRVAWLMTNGRIPQHKPFVLHKCDTPLCVRPDHLFLGTQEENVTDRQRKGRSARGEMFKHPKHPRTLTVALVQAIRAAYPAESTYALARRYGVSRVQIGNIVKRRQWAHVP